VVVFIAEFYCSRSRSGIINAYLIGMQFSTVFTLYRIYACLCTCIYMDLFCFTFIPIMIVIMVVYVICFD